MRMRTFILISLLISQPVAAFTDAGPLTADPQGDVTAYCESGELASTQYDGHDGHDGNDGDSHTDCETDCGQCASCAASIANAALALDVRPVVGHAASPRIQLPPGNADLLYRPPINS